MKKKNCSCGMPGRGHSHNDPKAHERVTVVVRAPQGWGKTWFGEMIAKEMSAWKGIKVALIDPAMPVKYFGPRKKTVGARVSIGLPL